MKNDAPVPFQGTLILNATAFDTGKTVIVEQRNINIEAGAGAIQWFESPSVKALDRTSVALEAVVLSKDDIEVSRNFIALTTPEHMGLLRSNVSVTAQRMSDMEFVAQVRCDAVAMFVTLTTLAHGRFEDNSFLLRPPGTAISFELAVPSPHASAENAWQTFSSSLRVEDVAAYRQH